MTSTSLQTDGAMGLRKEVGKVILDVQNIS